MTEAIERVEQIIARLDEVSGVKRVGGEAAMTNMPA